MVLQRSLWSLLCFRYYQHLIIPACLPADTVCVPFRVICNSWCLSRGVKERELTPSSGISSAFVAMSTKPAPNTQWPICFDGSRVYRWHSKMPCVQLRDPQHIWFSSVTSRLSIVNCLKHTWKMTLNKVETITFQFTGIYYKNRIGWSQWLSPCTPFGKAHAVPLMRFWEQTCSCCNCFFTPFLKYRCIMRSQRPESTLAQEERWSRSMCDILLLSRAKYAEK